MPVLTPIPGRSWAQFLEEGNVLEDFCGMFLGRHLGSGEYRGVWEAGWNPKRFIVKIEPDNPKQYFCNVLEWTAWNDLEGTDAQKWLAPCVQISPSGKILVMARTEPLEEDELPDVVPDFLADTHAGNFGRYEGRVVCHDYAFNKFHTRGSKRIRLVKRSG